MEKKNKKIGFEELHYALVNNTTTPSITMDEILTNIMTESTLSKDWVITPVTSLKGDMGVLTSTSGLALSNVLCNPSDGNDDVIDKVSYDCKHYLFAKKWCSSDILNSILKLRMPGFDISGTSVQSLLDEEHVKAIAQDLQYGIYMANTGNSPITKFDKTDGIYASLEAASNGVASKLSIPSPLPTVSTIGQYLLDLVNTVDTDYINGCKIKVGYKLYNTYEVAQKNSPIVLQNDLPVEKLAVSATGYEVIISRPGDVMIFMYEGPEADYRTEYKAFERAYNQRADIMWDVVINPQAKIVYVR